MKVTPRVLVIGAACLVLGGLAMGAGPRVTQASTSSGRTPSIDPFAPKAASSAAPVGMPGENDPPGRAVRKHRPPVRPVHRPFVRSPFRPGPRR
jgi:hypothetical protein